MAYKKVYIALFWLIIFGGLLFLTSYISLASYEQGVQTLIIVIAMALVLRVFRKVVWPLYQERTGRLVPHILVDLADFVVISTGILFIVIFVFKKDLWSIAAAGGLVAAGFVVALQDIIQDIFGAVVLDVDVPYKVGDWIKLNNDVEGEVVKITWRHTELLKHEKITFVPNGHLIRAEFTNFSRPEQWLTNVVTLTLEAAIPVERSRRIIQAAVMKLTSIHGHTCDVYADTITDKGITYHVRYLIASQNDRYEARHDVIGAITEALRIYGINVGDQIGEYLIRTVVGPKPTELPALDIKNIIQLNSLFQDAPAVAIDKAVSLARLVTLREGTPIMTKGEQGTSLYLIAEGAVAVTFSEKGKNVDRILALSDFFGERALYLNEPRNSDVTARTDVILLELTRENMTELFQEFPQLIDTISDVITERDKDRLQALTLKETKQIADKKTIAQRIGEQIRELFRL